MVKDTDYLKEYKQYISEDKKKEYSEQELLAYLLDAFIKL